MVQSIKIEEFIALSGHHPVLDVRSPGEFAHAHIPGAYSLPLFTDEERKFVGTLYKQQGREDSIKSGLGYFGAKMRKMVEDTEAITQGNKIVLVHCWRGGMRSAGVSWLLDLYGFKVYTLTGGYKSFRNWSLQQFANPYPLRIIGGYTGSGKTALLAELTGKGHAIIDLEAIAHHKGSAFGGIDMPAQPTQEMFENTLATALHTVADKSVIWIEDESRRIGNLNLPTAFWQTLLQSPVYFIDSPFEERLEYIIADYGRLQKQVLIDAITRIQKRLGGLNAKNAINYLIEDNTREAFRILLTYYDKCYRKGIDSRENISALLTLVPCETIDPQLNTQKIIDKATDGIN